MIRPSSLSIARHCQLAPVLSERWPTKSAATDRGNDVDAQATGELTGGPKATDADARAIVAWFAEHMPGWSFRVQAKIQLFDADTGGLLTEGTPDVQAEPPNALPGDIVVIVDIKKREQRFAGRLPAIDDSLQLHAYALAAAQGNPYQLVYLLFGDGDAESEWSRVYTPEDQAPILEEIRGIQARSRHDPRPTEGPHCLACYPRIHCPTWALPAHQGPSELEPFTQPGGLSVENFGKALLAVTALEEVAERARDQLKAFAKAHGAPVPVGAGKAWGPVWNKGKAGIDAEALKADGLLEKYTRRGAPYPTYRIVKERP